MKRLGACWGVVVGVSACSGDTQESTSRSEATTVASVQTHHAATPAVVTDYGPPSATASAPTGDTAAVTHDTEDTRDTAPTDDTAVEPRWIRASVDCRSIDMAAPIDVVIEGSLATGGRAVLDMVSTGRHPHRYEAHPIGWQGVQAGWTRFESSILSMEWYGGQMFVGYEPGVASAFWCATGTEIGSEPSTMTYVARVYDGGGALWHCIATGHDAEGVLRGDYDDQGHGIDGTDVSEANCVVVPWPG